MIETLPAPDHVIALRIAGTITGGDVDGISADVEAKLKRHDKLGVVVDIVDMDDMTAEAARKDLRYAFSKLAEWHRFPRKAVVTDKQWVGALYGFIEPLVPQVKLRTFAPDEREQAMAWASDVQQS